MDKIIQSQRKENIQILTVTRPKALNALNSQFFTELNETLTLVQNDPGIRVLLITGAEKAFVAGADIAEMQNFRKSESYGFSKNGQDTFNRLANFHIPVIGAINGFCLGGGLELALACDVLIASEKAKFSTPEVSLGLIPGFGATQRLSRLLGQNNALYLLLSGEMIQANEAKEIGLVQKVVEHEVLLEETLKFANTICAKGPEAVKSVKKVLRKGYEMSFEKGLELEREEFSKLFEGEGKEGMAAFLEKRKPDW